jgi:hypothetical protein
VLLHYEINDIGSMYLLIPNCPPRSLFYGKLSLIRLFDERASKRQSCSEKLYYCENFLTFEISVCGKRFAATVIKFSFGACAKS